MVTKLTLAYDGTDFADDDGDGFTEEGGDCDDADPDAFPGADEAANGADDDGEADHRADPELLARLREWRADEARRVDRPAYTVLADRALEEVAALRPATIAELARVRGIGPVKLDAYGTALLAVIARR